MKTYPTYDATGIKWNPTKPSHWEQWRGKRFFYSQKVKNIGNEEKNILSLTLKGVIRNSADRPIGLSPSDYSTYQIFEKDDLVFKLIDLNNISTSRVGLVPERGIMSSAYIRLTARYECNIRYFFLQYYDLWLRNIYNGLGAGVRQTLSVDDLLALDVVIPPREEQDQIVRFLDWKVSEINRLINIKRKEIARLEELKKAVVSHAVDNHNWKIVPLKRCLLSIADIDHYMPQSVDSGFPYVMTGDLKPNVESIDFEKCKQISKDDFKALSQKSKPQKGDIIFARYATIGTVCYVDIDMDFLVSYSCVTLKPNPLILGKYLFYYLKSNAFIQDINKYIKINTQGNVGIDSIRRAQIHLPDIEEQETIVRKLDNSCSQIDLMIENTKEQIQQLHEFKTRLISDVVTGKIDVRGIEIPEYEYTAEEADTDSEAESEELDEGGEEE